MSRTTFEALKQTLAKMAKDAVQFVEELEADYPKAFDLNNPIDVQARDLIVITLLSEVMNDFLFKYEDVLKTKIEAPKKTIIHQ